MIIRTVTFVLAIVLMGYTVYSWGDGSKQSMLITQLLLGCMVVGIGLQTYRRNENENKLVGIICLAVAILYICSLVKIF